MKFKEGDIIIDEAGREFKVLGVCGEAYFLSGINDFKSSGYFVTQYDLDCVDAKLVVDNNEKTDL